MSGDLEKTNIPYLILTNQQTVCSTWFFSLELMGTDDGDREIESVDEGGGRLLFSALKNIHYDTNKIRNQTGCTVNT